MDADKKKVIFIFGGLIIFLVATSIFMRSTTSSIREERGTKRLEKNSTRIDAPQQKEDKETMISSITVRIGDKAFKMSVDKGAAGQEFAKATPFELDMADLNGNEKYYYSGEALPKSEFKPGRIEAGDVMLYGDDCIVIFYESFDSEYSYTRLGKIQDTTGLAEALGGGSATVMFTKD